MLSYVDNAVTVIEADAYADARLWAEWTGADSVKIAAIRRSQDFIAAQYNHKWNSDWANDAAPSEVKYAIIEGAKRELIEPGSLNPDVTLGKIKTRVRVEGAVDVTYADTSAHGVDGMKPVVSIIDDLLAPFVKSSGFGGTVATLRV